MKYLIMLLFLVSFSSAQEVDNSFITKLEYGEMLYKNPRGIGCIKCHKKTDKSIILSEYKEIDKKTKKLVKKSIIVPAINNVSFEKFLEKMKADKTESKIMPTYFLTDDELKSLYYYIKNINKK